MFSVASKIVTYLLLKQMLAHLLNFQRTEQPGLTPGKSTRRVWQKLFPDHADFVWAKDSVQYELLWEILLIRWISARLTSLKSGVYSGTENAVKCV